jgi:hypothetical protein
MEASLTRFSSILSVGMVDLLAFSSKFRLTYKMARCLLRTRHVRMLRYLLEALKPHELGLDFDTRVVSENVTQSRHEEELITVATLETTSCSMEDCDRRLRLECQVSQRENAIADVLPPLFPRLHRFMPRLLF